jgi:hypothetical protein
VARRQKCQAVLTSSSARARFKYSPDPFAAIVLDVYFGKLYPDAAAIVCAITGDASPTLVDLALDLVASPRLTPVSRGSHALVARTHTDREIRNSHARARHIHGTRLTRVPTRRTAVSRRQIVSRDRAAPLPCLRDVCGHFAGMCVATSRALSAENWARAIVPT